MNNVDRFEELTIKMADTYRAKNHDYGDSFGQSIKEFGLVAAAVRMNDKMNRFKTLINKSAQVKDESIRDTLLDLANYAIMTVVEMDKAKDEQCQKDIPRPRLDIPSEPYGKPTNKIYRKTNPCPVCNKPVGTDALVCLNCGHVFKEIQ